jgi:alpha-L-fucosidase
MFDLRNLIFDIISFIWWMGLVFLSLVRGPGRKSNVQLNRKWWQRPGLGIMYQIETRPGWKWDRDYIQFNKSMMNENRAIKFNGPFCNIKEWIDLSRETGVDYHQFEIKWHDGICYYDTNTTDWKADKDYAREFADLSRSANIPFMYYYSSVFDHNPQFDSIQPVPGSTPSLIGNAPEYHEYLKKQYAEIIEQCRPDGMWFDWWWADGSTKMTAKEFREKYPDVIVAFNLSNLYPSSFNKIHMTSSEAHSYDGPWVELRKEDSLQVPVLTSAVKWSNALRSTFKHQWELISPAGKWWQDQSLREDPLELIRTLAMVLACGGKLSVGATSQMDGHILPDQVKQLRMLGEWYMPRKEYFINAAPVSYRWFSPPGVRASSKNFDKVMSSYGSGRLLHLINRTGAMQEVSVTLHGRKWKGFSEVTLMPQKKKISVIREGSTMRIDISPENIDPVDTILYLAG